MPYFNSKPGTAPVDHCNGSSRRRWCLHRGNCITAHGRSLLEAFRRANPGVLFTGDPNPCLSIISGRRPRAHHPCGGFGFSIRSILIDHEGAARVQEDQAVYIPQPYYTAEYARFDGQKETQALAESIARSSCLREKLSGMTLEVRYAGAGRSWYYPGHSALWVIGRPQAMATIDTGYPVPDLPPELTQRDGETIATTPEGFDVPMPCPTWTVELPDCTCRFVSRRGNRCGKATPPDSDLCWNHGGRPEPWPGPWPES